MAWRVSKEQEPAVQCSLVKSPTVYIEPVARQKIQLLMTEYTNQEWLAYLKGRISEKENIFVEDMFIPPHKSASGGEAEAEPFHIPKNCVGIIHSHHHMGAFHSGTDQNYVDKNFPVSITIAHNQNEYQYDAVSYQQTPCGKAVTLKCQVKYVQLKPLFDTEKFLKMAKDNIDKGKKPPYIHGVERPYIPVRYRMPGFPDYIVDGEGNVITPKEMEDIMKRIADGRG